MKKLLFVITKGQTGGAQKFVYEQIKVLSDSFDCYLATNSKGWLSESLDGIICDVFLDDGIEKLSFIYLIKLRKFIKKNNISLVICNSANGGFYGRLAAFFANTRSVYVSHGWSSVYNGGKLAPILNFIERALSWMTSSVLCISENDYITASSMIKISKKKLIVINNAILPFSNSNPIETKDKVVYKLLTIARLASPKRIDLLLQAIKGLENIELTIVGDGPNKDSLMKLAEEQAIENVVFLGEIKAFDNFGDFDLFALISDSEGLPMSAIEAMSFGMPLILSNVGGCSTLIQESGVLVENEVNSIRDGVLTCIRNHDLFTKNSFAFYQEKFNLEKNKQRFVDYYTKVSKTIV